MKNLFKIVGLLLGMILASGCASDGPSIGNPQCRREFPNRVLLGGQEATKVTINLQVVQNLAIYEVKGAVFYSDGTVDGNIPLNDKMTLERERDARLCDVDVRYCRPGFDVACHFFDWKVQVPVMADKQVVKVEIAWRKDSTSEFEILNLTL